MKRSSEKESKFFQPIGPYSMVVLCDNLLFVSGQIGVNPETGQLVNGIENQTRQIMENLKIILQNQGVGFQDVVKATIFLSSMEDFAVVNEIYGGYFNGRFPARSTVAVQGLPKQASIEIEMIVRNRHNKGGG